MCRIVVGWVNVNSRMVFQDERHGPFRSRNNENQQKPQPRIVVRRGYFEQKSSLKGQQKLTQRSAKFSSLQRSIYAHSKFD